MARRVLTIREQFEMTAPWLFTAAPMTVAPSSGGIVSGPGEPVGKMLPGATDARDPRNKLSAAGIGYDDMVDNLVSHYHGSSNSEKKSGRMWYRTAHNLFKAMGKDAGTSHARAVAVGSATSPNTDWNENVKHAGNMLMHYRPNDPNHNENDWQMAHIHPQARAAFQAANGRDPDGSDEDLHQLADLHAPHFARGEKSSLTNDLSDPAARETWMKNIQHHGIDNVLTDHDRQVNDNSDNEDANGNVIGYNPSMAMRDIMHKDIGMGTLGNNVRSAKNIIRAGPKATPDDFAGILKGPKVRNFMSNILDKTRISRSGHYEHPNGDWTQHEDLGGTIDAHHLRAATMAHGEWQRKQYRDKASKLNPSDPATYDVFNRGLLDATHRVNSTIQDPTKHITPKQLQAIVWLKHKNDNERFKAMPINHQSEITPGILRDHKLKMKKKQDAADRALQRQMAALDPREIASMPPAWRKMFITRVVPEWTDLLESWVNHNSPEPAEHDGSDPSLDPRHVEHVRQHGTPPANEDQDPRLGARTTDPFEFADALGPHGDDPWLGPEAEALDAPCRYCGAGRAELCDPHCPTHHFYDEGDDRAMGGSAYSPPNDLHTRLNSVEDVLAYSAAVVKKSEFGKALMKSLRDTGGFSFRDPSQALNDAPKSGYMVSQTPDFHMPAKDFTPEHALQFWKQHKPHLDANPDHYIGGWHENDNVYLERSKNHPDYHGAIPDAYGSDQIALHDVKNNTDIDTPATHYRGDPGIWMARRS